MRMKAIITPLLIAASASRLFAAEPVKSDGFADGIDRSDPNFVTASLLVMSPGDELYSCAGHSVIRLECPKFNLDYCFSYESESVKGRILAFFLGKLKMGMFAIPTEKFLEFTREARRGVMQYPLNLPPDVKQRLWEILDKKVAEGPNLPYDYLKRGCAQACFVILRQALAPNQMVVPSWPDEYSQTRREFGDAALSRFPWTRFALHTFMGAELDRSVTNYEKVIFSKDLLARLKTATVDGKVIVDGDGIELLATPPPVQSSIGEKIVSFFTPLVVSFFVVLAAMVNCFQKSSTLDGAFIVCQSLLGLFQTYLVIFSGLPATDWNWLIVPFNLLPLIFWKWRTKWALWFAGLLLLWEIGMIAYPHRLTDPAYLVLVAAYIVFYCKVALGSEKFNLAISRWADGFLPKAIRWLDNV